MPASPSLMWSIERHEGCKLTPFQDDVGNWTLGIGHLMSNPITKEAAYHILKDDLQIALDSYDRLPHNITAGLSQNRKDVLVEMIFQMGLRGVMRFQKMLKALEYNDYETACAEMIDSEWYRKYTTRAENLVQKFRKG